MEGSEGKFSVSRAINLLVIFLMVAAIPLTVYLAQQQQEIRQRAQTVSESFPIPSLGPSYSVDINIDATQGNHPISPLIYGITASDGAESYHKDMGASFIGWSGNFSTRYNWEIKASNAGSEGHFRNISKNSAEDFVNKNRSIGAESLISIPLIGWVAKDTSSQSSGVPSNGGSPASQNSDIAKLCDGSIYDPTANRNITSIKSVANKNNAFSDPPDTGDGTVYQDEWVNHLKSALGSAEGADSSDPKKHGIRFYSMDNKMDLWADSTHIDIHPVRTGYDETLKLFSDYAGAIKTVDTTAEIAGPGGSGWLSLWYSGLDKGCGSSDFQNPVDRKIHGNIPFYQWFLREVKKNDDIVGYRTLDILDVHYFPQDGVYSNNTDAITLEKRLRSTRSLWDPTYTEESWQKDTEGGQYLRLIPRLKEWINKYYPGTKLGITEWNWGASNHISGGLAIADVLGIYGREDLYLANYYGSPANLSPGYWAWRMYRNYDGKLSGFGNVSVKAQVNSVDIDKISVYASKDTATKELKVMLINKMSVNPANVKINIANYPDGAVKVYRYSNIDTTQIRQLSTLAVSNGSLLVNLDPYSITLLVIDSSIKITPLPTQFPTVEPTQLPTSIPTTIPTKTNNIPVSLNNGGFVGIYYDSMSFTDYKFTRNDSRIDFNWGGNSPDPRIDKDTFSVTWNGSIIPAVSNTYTFYADADDGVRLWIDNDLIIDQFNNAGAKEFTQTKYLNAGQMYNIRMAYFENNLDSLVRLSWSSPSLIKQIIAAPYLQ